MYLKVGIPTPYPLPLATPQSLVFLLKALCGDPDFSAEPQYLTAPERHVFFFLQDLTVLVKEATRS